MKKIISLLVILNLICLMVPVYGEEKLISDLNAYSFQQLISLRDQIDAKLLKLTTDIDISKNSMDGIAYVSNGSEIRINSYDGIKKDVVIPATIDGLPVTQIHSNAFKNNKIVSSIVLPEGMTEIPDDFFEYCSNLRSVIIPSTIITIGYGAFRQTGIRGVIVLPSAVSSLGRRAFCNSDVTGVIIQSDLSVEDAAFWHTRLRFIYVKENCVASFHDKPFDSSLELAILPASVTTISDNAFIDCNRLTIVCPSGSYAESYAKQHFIMCDTDHYDQFVQEYDSQY